MITGIMAVGAIFGAVNTMYAAVAVADAGDRGAAHARLPAAEHPRELPRRVGGDRARSAGSIGCLLALPMNGIVTSTTNWANFSEIAFSFRITPGLLLAGLIFARGHGDAGRVLPRAAGGEGAGGAGDPVGRARAISYFDP